MFRHSCTILLYIAFYHNYFLILYASYACSSFCHFLIPFYKTLLGFIKRLIDWKMRLPFILVNYYTRSWLWTNPYFESSFSTISRIYDLPIFRSNTSSEDPHRHSSFRNLVGLSNICYTPSNKFL